MLRRALLVGGAGASVGAFLRAALPEKASVAAFCISLGPFVPPEWNLLLTFAAKSERVGVRPVIGAPRRVRTEDMEVAIIKYNAGNIRSVVGAFRRLGVEPVVTDDARRLAAADRIVFPGQGEASTTMGYLRGHGLDRLIAGLRQPVLGICIGQQLLCARSEEGDTPCIGVFGDVEVKRFVAPSADFKIPHVGWNTLGRLSSPLFDGVGEGDYAYFIHSYYVPDNPYSIATTDYIVPFCSALRRDNFYATQFHPEKSGRVGERILQNFLNLPE